jgi:hypothetical protein
MKTRRVIAHMDMISMVNCKFKVSRAGRDRVRRTKVKNVHAGIIGTIGKIDWGLALFEVKYNPYHNDSFYCEEFEQAVVEASDVFLKHNGKVFVSAYKSRE